MKLIGAINILLVASFLLVNVANIFAMSSEMDYVDNTPETVDQYLRENEPTSSNSTEETSEDSLEDSLGDPLEDPLEDSSENSSENSSEKIIETRGVNPFIPMDYTHPFNDKPGIVSKAYDQSDLFYFRHNRTIGRFDVRKIYEDYLKRPGNYRSYVLQGCAKFPPTSITGQALHEAIEFASMEVQKEIGQSVSEFYKGNFIPSHEISTDGRHFITGKTPDQLKNFIDQEESSYLEYIGIYLKKKLCLRPLAMVDQLTKIPANVLQSKFLKCSRNKYMGMCKNYDRYRTYDGSCNNLEQPFWGKSNICHVRFLPPAYSDGLYLPRMYNSDGKDYLPSPRLISTHLHFESEGESFLTPWHFTWGQYMIHDMISTPQIVNTRGSGISCCNNVVDESKCMPIRLSSSDVQKRSCINFVRSAPCPLCQLGPRQQINLASSYLDQSAMYGSDNETVASLRVFIGGLLAVGMDKYKAPILPDSISLTDQCSQPEKGKNHICFRSGDARVNQQPFIQLIHTLFIRRHNQHAQGLARVNPHATDEILFQEARRITIAELQHITYYEYLPTLLGPEMVDYFELIEKDSLFTEYEVDVDATTWNECASAACRFGHSQVTSMMKLTEMVQNLELKNSFFNPELVHSGLTPNLIATLLNNRAAVIDPYLTPSLKNFLYHKPGKDIFGSDLAAFNIQRGRDHGIPPYVDYVHFCFGYQIKKWQDLAVLIDPVHIAKLSTIYKSFQDIDLFTGGLYERKAIDSNLGSTFSCIVGIQFYHLKFGDRYFYTHSGQAGSFTPAQLVEMKQKFSLTNLLCLTEPKLRYAQKYAFLGANFNNPNVRCSEMRQKNTLNYNLWRFR